MGSRCLYPIPRSEEEDSRKMKMGGIVKKTISRRMGQRLRRMTTIVIPSRMRKGNVLLMTKAAGKYQRGAPG
jgi:hypothetical protein